MFILSSILWHSKMEVMQKK